MSEEAISQCCQLVKENSIDGCKKDRVDIVYTPCGNLKKNGTMDTGQVGFHKKADVRKCKHVEKDKPIVKELYKTKEEVYPDFQELLDKRNQRESNEKKKIFHAEKAAQKIIDDEHAKIRDQWRKAENAFIPDTDGPTNKDADSEEDFM